MVTDRAVAFDHRKLNMDTQADSAPSALGKSLDGAGMPVPPADFPHGNTSTHDMLAVQPSEVNRWDIIRWGGEWRTVSSVLGLANGDTSIYFREIKHGSLDPALFSSAVLAITVYRPKTIPTGH